MPINILMPALSPTMEEGTLVKWLVKEGDIVRAGDVIAEIETDKAIMEVETIDDGRVQQILIKEGSEGVKVNTPIAIMLAEEGQGSAPELSSAQAMPEAQDTAYESNDEGQIVQASQPERGQNISGQRSAVTGTNGRIGQQIHMLTVREALRDAMAEEMRRDQSVFVMGEEVADYQGAYKVTHGLLEEFGAQRVIDTPITEHGFSGLGVGAAFAGLKPIVEFMTWNFAMQAIDQIVNSAAKTLYMSGGQIACPIVFRGPNGAASRVAAQHSQCYSAWFAHVPGLKVVAPFSATDAKGLLKSAIRDPNPVIFLENEILYGQSFEVPYAEDFVVPIGKAKILRDGDDLTIVAFSRAVSYALEAAEILSNDGIESEVIDLRSLRPLDIETILASIKKTNRIVTVEESWPVASIGAEICARVSRDAFDYLDAPPIPVSAADVPMPYAANLERLALPNADKVVRAARVVCYAD